MKLDKYIHDLLLENETVIIPGLGAFISNYVPAEITEKEIKPPAKNISFNHQVKTNDGLLVNAIAKKAKISRINALKRIDRERENIIYQLDKGEKVTFKNLGQLYYNDQNKLEFTPFTNENLLLDSFGLEPIIPEDIVEKPVEQVVTPDFETEAVLPEPEAPLEPELNETSVNILQETVQKIKLPEFKPELLSENQHHRKKTGWYWFLLIIPIAAVVLYFFFIKTGPDNSGKNQTPTISNKSQAIVPPIAHSDSVRTDSVAIISNMEQKKATENENKKYIIVGGAFKKEENAEKFIEKLRSEKGIEGIRIGKRGNLYLVGIASFNTEAEAFNTLNDKIKENPEWSLWVYKKTENDSINHETNN